MRNGGLAERREEDVGEPRRAARRSGTRSDARCPSAGRPSGARRCPRSPRPAAGSGGSATNATIPTTTGGSRRPSRRTAHHPSSLPQATPQTLTAMDTRTSPTVSGIAQGRPRATRRSAPRATSDERERDDVVAEAVAELDPALAEVHQVDHDDEEDRERRSRDQPAPPVAAQGREREQVGGAGEEDAHADVARDGQRTGQVEQAAGRAGLQADRRGVHAERVGQGRRAGCPARSGA